MLGREIIKLVNEEKIPGNYEVKFDGKALSSGVYFYILQSGFIYSNKKLMLIK